MTFSGCDDAACVMVDSACVAFGDQGSDGRTCPLLDNDSQEDKQRGVVAAVQALVHDESLYEEGGSGESAMFVRDPPSGGSADDER